MTTMMMMMTMMIFHTVAQCFFQFPVVIKIAYARVVVAYIYLVRAKAVKYVAPRIAIICDEISASSENTMY